MKTFLNKILATFMAAFACLWVVSCESKDSDTIQAEVVFPSDVNLTKIDQWESSMELEQLGTNIPFALADNGDNSHRRGLGVNDAYSYLVRNNA